MKLKFLNLTGLLVLFFTLPGSLALAQAQAYPDKDRVIHVICGFPTGSGADILVRYYADRLAAVSGQKAIVENKPGMLSGLAAKAVAGARPDGYTIFITAASSSHAANLYLFKQLPYDPIKDFTPVATLAKVFFVLTVDSKSPHTTVKGLTDAMEKLGDKANYAYASPTALAATELYKVRTGIQALGIPFKTALETLSAMQDRQIDFQFVDSVLALQQIRAGRLRGLAVTSAERSGTLPELPTMIEAGIPEFDVSPWWAVFLPANAPQQVVEKLESWFNRITAAEDSKSFLANMGADPFPGDAKFMAAHLAREIRKWGELIKLAKIQPQ